MDCVSIGSGNGLSPVRRQAITWTNAGLLSIGILGTYFSEIWIRIVSFPFKKMQLKMLSARMAAILSRGRWVIKKSASLVEETIPVTGSLLNLCGLRLRSSCIFHWLSLTKLGHIFNYCGYILGYCHNTIFSKILTIDTTQLAREGEIWGVFCEFKVWPMNYHGRCLALYNIMLYFDVL